MHQGVPPGTLCEGLPGGGAPWTWPPIKAASLERLSLIQTGWELGSGLWTWPGHTPGRGHLAVESRAEACYFALRPGQAQSAPRTHAISQRSLLLCLCPS